MKHAIRTATVFAFASLCLCSGAGAKLVTFQVPGGMYLAGMNDKGQVTGWYIDNRTTAFHGFLRQPDNTVTTFDGPAALTTKQNGFLPPEETIPSGISEDGVITGQYGINHMGGGSFIRAASGAITPFSVGLTTVPYGISPTGWIVGRYRLEGTHRFHAFLRDPTGAKQDVSVPGAHNATYPSVVNRSRAIAGVAGFANGSQAFFRPAHGKAAVFGDSHAEGVAVTGINVAGTVVGYFAQAAEWRQCVSFFRTSDGTITTFTGPDGATDTKAYAINKAGTIAGTYIDSSNNEHGFIRAGDGTLKTVDVEGAAYTDVRFINNKGEIAGTYYNNGTYGFVGKP